VRNRLIEYLEMIVDCERDPPPWDLNETLNQWEDWNPPGARFEVPPYTGREGQLLDDVALAWGRLCDATPEVIFDLFRSPEWAAFTVAARHALSALNERGRLSEEEESSGSAV